MWTFTLAISCLITSNLPWFMNLTFQVPMQYCSLQHRICAVLYLSGLLMLLSTVTSTTGCCFHFGSIPSFFLELFLHWSPVAYWRSTNINLPTNLPTWGVYLSVSYLFAFSYCSWGSQGKSTEVVCHSLLQWPTFCQNSPPWPVRLGWPHTAWLIVSLSEARLWSMWSVRLVFCGCGFHSVSPLMDEDVYVLFI